MADGWREAARVALLRLRGPSGWGERAGAPPRVEPTALAGLGLLADGHGSDEALRRSADWLAGLQQPDGPLGISPGLAAPHWTTPHAILFWAALGRCDAPRDRAVRWLLGQRGIATADPMGVFGHDTSLIGWPWVEDTHSWLEPTALAVLALRRQGLGDHARTREGLQLIRNRAIRTGGWNYGNSTVLGRTLRPQPGPTGLALLALAGIDRPSPAVGRAIAYLQATLPEVRSAPSLCWGLLGLRAWGRRPAEAGSWLAEAHALAHHRGDSASRLALLLLAASDRALGVLGMDAADSA
jgi:hypothetical protein